MGFLLFQRYSCALHGQKATCIEHKTPAPENFRPTWIPISKILFSRIGVGNVGNQIP